jgi:hypothetical protein
MHMNPVYNPNILSQDDSALSEEDEYPKKVKKSKKYIPNESYRKKYKKEDIDSEESYENPNKINWRRYMKAIVIYTLLFLIMSHVKMNSIVCGFIPYLNTREIFCMIVKGIIMSILILIIQKLY